MTPDAAGPGKTAPKLFQDFLVFDPLNVVPNASILTSHPTPVGDGDPLKTGPASCKHEYTAKSAQSVAPPLDARPSASAAYKLAAVCKKCRIHADLKVDYAESLNPCPTPEHPLHHFQRVAPSDQVTQDRIIYAWRCSIEGCYCTLFITYRLPKVSSDHIELLTNPERLKSRYNAMLAEDPHREGVKQATRTESLSRLRRYLLDSLNEGHSKRQFPAANKRFQEAFGIRGHDCQEFLERLGFKYADGNWNLPHPAPVQDRLLADGTSHREILEDIEFELLAWQSKVAAEAEIADPVKAEQWPPADRDLQRTLAAQDYQRHLSFRRAVSSNTDHLRYFHSLGALPDFADPLIEYAYDRQMMCDPGKQQYYFECLQVISESRNTEALQMKVATLQSQDVVSRRDVLAAFRFLGINPAEGRFMDDARVIQSFQLQQADSGAAAQEEARAHLHKIGVARGSMLLINTARQSVDTYEDALAWLGNGADKSTSDEGLLAVLTMKIAESAANEETGQKAMSTIAKARQSNFLNNWLLTGKMDNNDWSMSVDEALRHLGIEQKLESLDKDVLPAIFENARFDRPGETTDRAISAIQGALSGQAQGSSNTAQQSNGRPPETWPVGLMSHGNTCYLNSLLQYYFSIKPLREIILHYDDYKLDTNKYGDKEERVGQRKITRVETKGGQRFADDLKELFERMITTPGSAVRPEADLVCRAFLPPSEYSLLQSSYTNEAEGAGGAQADSVMEDTTEKDEPNGTDALMADATEKKTEEVRHNSDASSVTLQASVDGNDQDVQMQNGESQAVPITHEEAEQSDKPEPEHAPPLPPRRFSTTQEQKQAALAKAEENARQQQDVTEVHDGITFRLRSGMMPRSHDAAGEQEDALRDLFAIRVAETSILKSAQQGVKELTDSAVQLNVPYEDTDIYSALDAVFDLQPHHENPDLETFKSIRSIPPVLQMNIPRIGFDDATKLAYKSDKCVRLEDELYMDRYCDYSHPKTLAKRRECWGWRRELQQLRRERKVLTSTTPADLDGPTAIAETANYLASLDEVNADLRSIDIEPIAADGDITSALHADAQTQTSRLTALDSEISALQARLASRFAAQQNIHYRLAAVFFHRGNHGSGHYWIYIRDFAAGIWRLYNDETVSKHTNMADIVEARSYAQGTPTLAVYVAANRLDCVEAVCRALEPEPEPAAAAAVDWKEQGATTGGVEMRHQDARSAMQTHIEGGQADWDVSRSVAEARW